MSQPKLALERCAEKRRRFESIVATMQGLVILRQHELEALTRGNFDESERIDAQADKLVTLKRTQVKEYQLHIELHGC